MSGHRPGGDENSEFGIRNSEFGNVTAFTLVEMMVTVALLSFIVLGLTAMFVQTQRAFRAGMTQTDVLEAGRATMEMLTREIEQMSPSDYVSATNFYVDYVNAPTTNVLTASSAERRNVTGRFFFLSRDNRRQSGVGYRVTGPYDEPPFTLYRCYTNFSVDENPVYLSTNFFSPFISITNPSVSRLIGGVVHLRIRAYSTNGVLLTQINDASLPPPRCLVRNAFIYTNFPNSTTAPGEINYNFTNNAVPAYVELELGVLENDDYERYKAIPSAAAKTLFFKGRPTLGLAPTPGLAGRIHIFRRRIAVHNVDPEVYQ